MVEIERGLAALQEAVLGQGMCARCGACVGLCPYLLVMPGKVSALANCTVSHGRCYHFCPRTDVDLPALHRSLPGNAHPPGPIGSYETILMARAHPSRRSSGAQYGGVATAALITALEGGRIGVAVATGSQGGLPLPVVARSREEVEGCAGSKFGISPTVSAVNRLLRQGVPSGDPIGVVALPCQVWALRRMQQSGLEAGARRITLIIGLFCTWALDPCALLACVQERLGPLSGERPIDRMDIPPPPARVFNVYIGDKEFSIPLDELKRHLLPTCALCPDMTAELADLAIGAMEGYPGWCTLVVRTATGAALLEEMIARQVVETAAMDADSLAHLEEASDNKRRRAMEEVDRRRERSGALPFLTSMANWQHFLEQA